MRRFGLFHQLYFHNQLFVGYRVHDVHPNSPAEKGGLASFFDFIIAADGKQLTSMDSTFVNLIQVNCLQSDLVCNN